MSMLIFLLITLIFATILLYYYFNQKISKQRKRMEILNRTLFERGGGKRTDLPWMQSA